MLKLDSLAQRWASAGGALDIARDGALSISSPVPLTVTKGLTHSHRHWIKKWRNWVQWKSTCLPWARPWVLSPTWLTKVNEQEAKVSTLNKECKFLECHTTGVSLEKAIFSTMYRFFLGPLEPHELFSTQLPWATFYINGAPGQQKTWPWKMDPAIFGNDKALHWDYSLVHQLP
jgi:hypothetical protein